MFGKCIEPWKDLWSRCGVPGIDWGGGGYPGFEISAMDRALRTVVAPEIIDGGTEDGPIVMAAAAGCPTERSLLRAPRSELHWKEGAYLFRRAPPGAWVDGGVRDRVRHPRCATSERRLLLRPTLEPIEPI